MKIALILLAAGNSERFQGNKLLHDYRGKPIYRHIADVVSDLPDDIFSQKIIVTQYQEIMNDPGLQGFEKILNKHSSRGISHSIHLGITAVTDPSAAVCFAVCDQPELTGGSILHLICRWKDSPLGIACLSCRGKQGNPAIFDMKYRPLLLELQGDSGGKQIMKRYPEDILYCEIDDPAELMDIDIREDLP